MNDIVKPLRVGVLACVLLLVVYFVVLTLVSGWDFARTQFATFWCFVVALAVGSGVQIGLYSYLRRVASHADASGKVVTVSGATSTGAMISCCAHYLTNVLPVLGPPERLPLSRSIRRNSSRWESASTWPAWRMSAPR